jgi:hypothetical protein
MSLQGPDISTFAARWLDLTKNKGRNRADQINNEIIFISLLLNFKYIFPLVIYRSAMVEATSLRRIGYDEKLSYKTLRRIISLIATLAIVLKI